MDALRPTDASRPPKFLENGLLAVLGVLCLMILSYQLPRWANGLDPTFVHPKRFSESAMPLVLHLAAAPPAVWLALMVAAFARICANYGWCLSR